MSQIEQAIKRSRRLFLEKVWPEISTKLGGGELVPIEGIGDYAARCGAEIAHVLNGLSYLDKYSGIDYLQIDHDRRAVRGLSTRVQEPKIKAYFDTVTIRKKKKSGASTEYDRLVSQIEWGAFHPFLHIQAYVAADVVSAIFVAKMDDIITIIKNGKYGSDYQIKATDPTWGQFDGVEFAIVNKRTFEKWGFDVYAPRITSNGFGGLYCYACGASSVTTLSIPCPRDVCALGYHRFN